MSNVTGPGFEPGSSAYEADEVPLLHPVITAEPQLQQVFQLKIRIRKL